MNRGTIAILALLAFWTSCIGEYSSDAKAAIVGEKRPQTDDSALSRAELDLTRSLIHWKGTKMRGAGKHEGEVFFKEGFLLLDEDQLKGGSFVVDMSTLQVTDIPEHEPIPRRNVNNHLKSADFFAVETYPTASFVMVDVKPVDQDSMVVTGNLRIKDITRSIQFGARRDPDRGVLRARFTFDRFDWNIAYEGSWADKTLVDRDVELTIRLALKKIQVN